MGLLDIFKKKDTGNAATQHPLAQKISEYKVENLHIKDENGIVTVSGLVEDGSDVGRIVNILKKEPGVRRLIQEIEVKDIRDKNLRYTVRTKVRFLNVRSGPSTDEKIAGKLPNDTEVLLLKKISKNWFYIKSDELEGYCNSDYLLPIE